MQTFETILVTEAERVLTLALNRPARRNALTAQMIDELTRALAAAAGSGAGVVILTGAGEAFCSGLDLEELKVMSTRTPAEHLADSQAIATLLRTLYDLPLPTVAAVNGAAVAGGMGLATICDFTLAAPEAKFGYTEVRIGFIPAIVSAYLLTQVGEKRARDLLLTGRLIDAAEALSLGLVTRIVEADALLPAANDLARLLLRNSPESLRATKRLLSEQARERLDRAIQDAVQANADLRQTADFREGLASFLEKRRPAWPSLDRAKARD
ncbi:MAG: enoyl-CoA hydratase-related protein [Acidobacteriaceae bacterium]